MGGGGGGRRSGPPNVRKRKNVAQMDANGHVLVLDNYLDPLSARKKTPQNHVKRQIEAKYRSYQGGG